jgi:pimeloyl-ACP methyl ester carboxylesterase
MTSQQAHLVGHSYGGVAATIAAIRRPSRVRSLTLFEPALFLPSDDPDVARFRRLGDEFLTHGLRTEPTNLREFLTIAGARVPDTGPLPDEVVRSIRRAQGSRPPSEASPPLEVLRERGIRSLVASGDHHVAVERMCDAVATVIGAQRMIAPGTGHFVAEAPGFAHELESFFELGRMSPGLWCRYPRSSPLRRLGLATCQPWRVNTPRPVRGQQARSDPDPYADRDIAWVVNAGVHA